MMNDNMAFFREQMFKSASVTGGGTGNQGGSPLGGNTLTPDGLKKAQQTESDLKRYESILAEAEKRGLVTKDDPLLKSVVSLFFLDAKTPDGRQRAVRLAVSVVHAIRKQFDVQPKGEAKREPVE